MLDHLARGIIDPPLNFFGGKLAKIGISANWVTIFAAVPAIGAFVAIWQGNFVIALCLIFFNRLLDGLDGAIARAMGVTDLGGYLDIVFDYVFYALIPLGFILYDPVQNAIIGAVLLCCFIGTGISFLAFAVFAQKRHMTTDLRGEKSLYYLGGITEGVETILFFAIFCLFPAWFPWLAGLFALLCGLTVIGRVAAAFAKFS